MRVLHAAKFYPPARGGMETVVADLCAGTATAWVVRVVAAHDEATTVRERIDGVDVVRSARYGQAASVPLCPTLPLHLWKTRADCVVLHEPNPIAGIALWARTPARRLVVWHHSDLLRPRWALPTYSRIVQRALYRRADCVIVSNPVLAKESPLVRCARHVAVIPFGIDLERFQAPQAHLPERLARWLAASAGPRLLFVGRLVYYKGLHVLIDAARQWPGTVWIAGDGPLESELRARAASAGARVEFLGRVTDEELPALYQAADAFVLPSIAKTETFGVVQVEAMAAGLPVVSTALPTGVPWVNQHGVTGLVVPPGDATALAAALCDLGANEALRRELGANGRRRAEELFSRNRMVAAFRDLIETVVREPERLSELSVIKATA
jgi:glycosyltransferase involved in cell wall biosynthesis